MKAPERIWIKLENGLIISWTLDKSKAGDRPEYLSREWVERTIEELFADKKMIGIFDNAPKMLTFYNMLIAELKGEE